ncbi:MAG: hypothetical protein PHH16_03355 [Candidatus Gracilibacteria bacterium]|nr:hypothetical protein [Candidatus Gracilibacteria bacterium]
MEGLAGQEEIDFPLELIKGSEALAAGVQTFCEGMLDQNFEGSDNYCAFIRSGQFAEAVDFSHTQLIKATTKKEKEVWLRLNNGAKAQVFLDYIDRGEMKRAEMYARGQLRWHSGDSIQLERILGTLHFEELRGDCTRTWSELLRNLRNSLAPQGI